MDTTNGDPALSEQFVDRDDMVMCRLAALVIDHVEEHYGREAAEQVVAATGRPREDLVDLSGWTSFETYNRVWKAAVQVTGDPDLGHRIGERALTSRALEYLLTMGRATGIFGDVGLGMRYLPDIINRSTRCVRYRALDVVGNLAVFEVREPHTGEFVRARCDYRTSMFRSLPTMSGITPEQVSVRHTQCMGDGYPACIYEVRWQGSGRSLLSRWWPALALAGAGAIFGLAWWAGASAISSSALAILSGAIITLLGNGRARAERLRESIGALQQQQGQMVAAHEAVEARYREQQAAYRALERKTNELERTQAELVRSERLAAMGRLVAGLAHEINNPLAGILTSAELLASYADEPRIGERAQDIIGEVERCRGLTRNMLAFGRQQPAQREVVDLRAVVDSAVDLAANQLRMAQVDVRVDGDEALTQVVGDPGQLQQVVLNLIENASFALAQRAGERRLRIVVSGGDEQVVVDFRDNGPGVSAEVRDQLFEPFFTTKGVGQGTGLGLSICDGIVATHGGSLTQMDLPEGHGAWFRFQLPREVDLPELPVPERELVPAVPLSPARVFHILVVDDEDLFRTSICRLLEQYGHRVDEASSAAEARTILAGGDDPDAILLDVAMPGESGVELHNGLDASLQLRVVFMTGNLGQQQEPALDAAVAERVLIKPFAYRELMEQIHRVDSRA